MYAFFHSKRFPNYQIRNLNLLIIIKYLPLVKVLCAINITKSCKSHLCTLKAKKTASELLGALQSVLKLSSPKLAIRWINCKRN
jgi:hypothetical protein